MVTYTVVSVSRCQCSSTRQCPHASIMIESVMGGTCDLGWDLGMGRRGVSSGWGTSRVEWASIEGHRGHRGTSSTSRGKTSSPLMCTVVEVSLQTSRGIEGSSRGRRGLASRTSRSGLRSQWATVGSQCFAFTVQFSYSISLFSYAISLCSYAVSAICVRDFRYLRTRFGYLRTRFRYLRTRFRYLCIRFHK